VKPIVERWHAEGVFGPRGGIRTRWTTAPCKSFKFCTMREGLICTHFGCANVMIEMGSKMIAGYARVSTDGQTLDAQQAALAAAGAERVFAEKVSGAVTDRLGLEGS
jgi:Resolvase, N terminal domain